MTTSNYPESYDTFDKPGSTDKANIGQSHSNSHKHLANALEAIQATLGTNPHAGFSTVAEKLAYLYGLISYDPSGFTPAQVANLLAGISSGDRSGLSQAIYGDLQSTLDARYLLLAGASSAGFVRTGSGDPRSTVTAPVGTVYIDAAATNGARLWFKASGSGNTGWTCINGDTGWRDITSSLANGWAATDVRVRRVDAIVHVRLNQLNPTSATDDVFVASPTGFGISSSGIVPMIWRFTGGEALPVGVSFGSSSWSISRSAHSVALTSASSGGRLLSFFTAEGWPTSLPGVGV